MLVLHSSPGTRNLVFSVTPGPFICNPRTARAVLLNMNSRFGDGAPAAGSNPVIRAPWLGALRLHADADFHPIRPEQVPAGGSDYWPVRLRQLIDEVGLDEVTHGLACVE